MTDVALLEITRDAITTLLMVLAPLLIGALIVGLAVSVFQAVTQVNEATLVFAPKLLVTVLVLLIAGPWMADTLVGFTVRMLTMLPQLVR